MLGKGFTGNLQLFCRSGMSREASSNGIACIRAIVTITSFAAYAAPTGG